MPKSQVIRLQLRSAYLDMLCEDDYVLTLPKTDEQLRTVRDRLGVKTFSECEITQLNSPLRVLEEMDFSGNVSLMNGITWAIERALEQDGEGSILLAVLEAFGKEGPRQLKERIEHRDCYTLLNRDICSEEGYGKYYFFQQPNIVNKELTPFIDFQKYGAAMLQKHPVYPTSAGWLVPEPGYCKIYMPLACKTEDGTGLHAGQMAAYYQEISDRLAYDTGKYLPASGLAEHSRLPDSIRRQVLSVFPAVEVHGGELWGCLHIKKQGWIPKTEMDVLANEWRNELEYGWGRHFRQQDIRTEDGTLYVDFCERNGDYRFFSEKEMREMEQSCWMDTPSQTL